MVGLRSAESSSRGRRRRGGGAKYLKGKVLTCLRREGGRVNCYRSQRGKSCVEKGRANGVLNSSPGKSEGNELTVRLQKNFVNEEEERF